MVGVPIVSGEVRIRKGQGSNRRTIPWRAQGSENEAAAIHIDHALVASSRKATVSASTTLSC